MMVHELICLLMYFFFSINLYLLVSPKSPRPFCSLFRVFAHLNLGLPSTSSHKDMSIAWNSFKRTLHLAHFRHLLSWTVIATVYPVQIPAILNHIFLQSSRFSSSLFSSTFSFTLIDPRFDRPHSHFILRLLVWSFARSYLTLFIVWPDLWFKPGAFFPFLTNPLKLTDSIHFICSASDSESSSLHPTHRLVPSIHLITHIEKDNCEDSSSPSSPSLRLEGFLKLSHHTPIITSSAALFSSNLPALAYDWRLPHLRNNPPNHQLSRALHCSFFPQTLPSRPTCIPHLLNLIGPSATHSSYTIALIQTLTEILRFWRCGFRLAHFNWISIKTIPRPYPLPPNKPFFFDPSLEQPFFPLPRIFSFVSCATSDPGRPCLTIHHLKRMQITFLDTRLLVNSRVEQSTTMEPMEEMGHLPLNSWHPSKAHIVPPILFAPTLLPQNSLYHSLASITVRCQRPLECPWLTTTLPLHHPSSHLIVHLLLE